MTASGKYTWFKKRKYKHLDVPVCTRYADRIQDPKVVAVHGWSPLLACVKVTKRYKPALRKTVLKERNIAYASHRDACILAKYAADLSARLDAEYERRGLKNAVLAYRKLGKSNVHFAAAARRFAVDHAPCVVHCFDVSSFFDRLDHKLLKSRLKTLLGLMELPTDWYKVFRTITKYRFVQLDEVKSHPKFAERIMGKQFKLIGTIAEIEAAGVTVKQNLLPYGIPQGTPISATLSNLYMIELDAVMFSACFEAGALYQRYSDDIIIICSVASEAKLVNLLEEQMAALGLQLNDDKYERVELGAGTKSLFQYLGFEMDLDGAIIRGPSLARQWRKARRAVRQTRKIGSAAMAAGKASKIYTSKLRKRFAAVPARNFSRYGRKAAAEMGSRAMLRQVRRLEKMVDAELRQMN